WRTGRSPSHRRISSGRAIFSSISSRPLPRGHSSPGRALSSAPPRPPPAVRLARGPPRIPLPWSEVGDIEDRAGALAYRLPDGFHLHPDPDLVAFDLTERVQEPAVRAIDRDHRGELGLVEGLHVPPHVADRERLHHAGLLHLLPRVGAPEPTLAEHPRWH